MRGKERRKLKEDSEVRITPAYAGKSPSTRSAGRCMQDHPRLCGEKSALTAETIAGAGSPPPMRGKVLKQQSLLLMKRITPAYAGKSGYTRRRTSGRWDHPRLCGEKLSVGLCSDKMTGSPPPMRGKAGTPARGLPADGITPAYAGKSNSRKIYRSMCQDHPRLCGEKVRYAPQTDQLQGSPPPMRGKEKSGRKTETMSRITPAYAGKSRLCRHAFDL